MRLLPLAILVASPATAVAKDEVFKAGDYEIVATDRNIEVRKGKRRATLIASSAFEVGVKVDSRAKKVTINRSEECSSDLSSVFTFDALEARLLNHESVSLHLKKDWANAAKGFAQAAKLDPTWNFAANNLASALTRLGKLDEANAALASWFSSAPLATYIQVSIDPDLQPLLTTKQVMAVRNSKPGTIKLGERGLDGEYAYSADRGWIAVHHDDTGYPPCGNYADIAIYDVKTNKQVGAIDIGGVPSSGGPCGSHGRAEITKAKTERLAKLAVAEKILTDFGFIKVPAEEAQMSDRDDGKRTARLPKARLGVVETDTGIRVLRGNTSLATGPGGAGRLGKIAYVPDARAMVVFSYVPSDTCARHDESVTYVPDPPPAKK